MPAPGYILASLLAVAFTLTTWLQPVTAARAPQGAGSRNLLALIMGDAQRLFAGLFFRKADVYFHSGYYPTIFDSAHTNEMHIAEQAGGSTEAGHKAGHGPEEHEEEGMNFLSENRDWIEKLRHQSMNMKHTHLDENGKVAEMLPWLRMSAELDPQHVETYIVTSYWLRGAMKRPDEALSFLREGMRANPDSYDLLYELGRLYRDSFKDDVRAHNLLDLADRKLQAHERTAAEPDVLAARKILVALAEVEEAQTNYPAAITHLERLAAVIPPEQTEARKHTQEEIERLRALR